MADRQQTTAVDARLSVSPTTHGHSMQSPGRDTTNKTDLAPPPPADPRISYLESLFHHYATISDKVTPYLFLQLCKDYSLKKSDEQKFYIASYRLFFETNATHLVPGLRAFLPAVWGELELDWLNVVIEEDSKRDRDTARKCAGDLALLMENVVNASPVPTESGVASRQLDLEATPTTPATEKRQPINGFMATYDPLLNEIDTTSRLQVVLTPRGHSNKTSPHHLSPSTRASPSFNRQPLTSKSSSAPNPPTRKPTKTKTKTKPHTSPNHSDPEVHETFSPTLATKRESKILPLASAVRHLGPIYPSTRAILARSHKPYIHAMCGQRFGHLAEVQRHHNGQSGRPGCWEKSGKPDGEDGQWDKDASCKIKLSDLEYVKVQEGWVVTSWGSVNVEGVREGEDGETSGGTATGPIMESGKGKKRKAVAKSKPALEVEARVESEDSSEDSSEDAEESDESPEPEEPEEPRAKRRKAFTVEEAGADAAVRAAALGLRTRK
jgi:hypothetical protein